MNTRKSIKLPIIITLLLIIIVVCFFTNIKQSKVTCEKTYKYGEDIVVKEELVTTLDNNKISNIKLRKEIYLSDNYIKDEDLIRNINLSLDRTLEYLGKKVNYRNSENSIIIDIEVKKDEVVLLDNIYFEKYNNDYDIKINSNTKSNSIVVLHVGENYTDATLMKKLKEKGYSCK